MRRQHSYHVYLLTNYTNSVIYTGVTSELKARITKHRNKEFGGFTATYSVWKLVYYEDYGDIRDAISREKQIKAGPRRKKVALIEAANPTWRDLYWDLED
jgi:putative endonuclease